MVTIWPVLGVISRTVHRWKANEILRSMMCPRTYGNEISVQIAIFVKNPAALAGVFGGAQAN